jgi:hypothetical protein
VILKPDVVFLVCLKQFIMKKTLTFLLLSLIILGTACRKKDNEPIVNTDPTTDEVAGGLVFLIAHDINMDSTLVISGTHAIAVFGDNVNPDIKVNSVLLDGIDIPNDSLWGYTYLRIPGTHNPSSLHWVVKGNNGIPDVDYTHTKGLPVFDWKTFAPDEIDVKKDLNLVFTGLKNTDYIEVVLSDFHGHSITKDLEDMSNPSVSFTTSELATLQFTSGEFFYLQYTAANVTFQVIGGKTFSFANEQSYYKQLTPH